ncbi:MAG: class I SAM-dependent methyltransferase [Oscillibacter sp.]|jgi:SAM-dependent methyltransferase|nr:class I SAM-dependent methyltransferase [Oscillibacter sp.]
MSGYHSLAGVYDALMADGAYEKRAAWLDRQLQRAPRPVRTVLDLGCGTGTIACLLARRGYRVTAADGSADMLTQAAQKASMLSDDLRPFFICQTMQRLRLPERMDAAVSTLDSLNYLTRSADLRETFRRVYRYLNPGGVFLFDVNSPDKLRRMDGQLWMDETADTTCVWRTDYSEKTGICTYHVDLFQLRSDGAWNRSWEKHRERAWEPDQLTVWLRETGFSRVLVYGDLRTAAPRSDEDRLIFRCEKNPERGV